MSLFDQLVDQALANQRALAPLRAVVEKELLHHDILRVLSQAGLLSRLTFIGGTCLRACYGASRLSEDLDFTGGADFTRDQLQSMASTLVGSLAAKYGLSVSVSDPVREEGNVSTWKIRVQTRPGRKDLPAQRINIDVCAIPSHRVNPALILNPYGVEMGTSGLILQAQSREEIFVDKLLAFALRPNRLKNRDVWDLAWLHQRQVKPAFDLLGIKLQDHRVHQSDFLTAFASRALGLKTQSSMAKDFQKEMGRFLPNRIVRDTVQSEAFWLFVTDLVGQYGEQAKQVLTGQAAGPTFRM